MNNAIKDAAVKLAQAWFRHDPKLTADTIHFTAFDAFFLFGISDPVTITIRREQGTQPTPPEPLKIEISQMAGA